MTDIRYVEQLPVCDIHKRSHRGKVPAQYEGRTTESIDFINMCGDCFAKHGVGLGRGKGVELLAIEVHDGEEAKEEIGAFLTAVDQFNAAERHAEARRHQRRSIQGNVRVVPKKKKGGAMAKALKAADDMHKRQSSSDVTSQEEKTDA